MKKLFALVMCVITVLCVFTSCSRPPELSDIEGRLRELIEASYGVNDILFGEGLAVYERVYEHKFEVYRDTESNKVYYYYAIDDAELGRIYGYRHTEMLYFISSDSDKEGSEYVYRDAEGNYYYEISYNGDDMEKEVSSYEDKESGVTYYFYKIADENYGTVYEYRLQTIKYVRETEKPLLDGSPIYTDSKNYLFYYDIDYHEPEYEFYYSGDEPEGYSYVRLDERFYSIDQIKEYAEAVYSDQYLEGVYEMLFTGAVISDDASGKLGARYYNYEDEDGRVWLMESDGYESLIKEKRIFDLSTAKVVRPGNKKFANVRIESYAESDPSRRTTVTLSLIKQDDGKWYLDSATY